MKICGITDVDDGLLAVALGADALGFVFAPSTRQVAPQRVRDIAARIPTETLTVGVFKDEAKERVVDIVHQAGLRAAQLHGDESPDDAAWIADRVPYVIKALSAGSDRVLRAREYASVAALLIDAPTPGRGEIFDWNLAEALPVGMRVILAGGLRPDNVVEAIEVVRPWGVDVSSGVESSPGRKDPAALRVFIQNAKAAGERLESAGAADLDDSFYDWEVDHG